MTAATGPRRVAAAELLDRWVRLYTRGLPPDVAAARRSELASDVFEHLAAASGSRAARRAVVGRTARGVVDDLAWRHEQRRTMKQSAQTDRVTGFRAAWAAATQSWFAPAAVLCALFDVLMAGGILLDDSSTMPGRVGGPAILLGFAASVTAGLRMRWRATRPVTVAPAADASSQGVPAVRYLVVVLAVASVIMARSGSRAGMIATAVALLALAATIPSWRRSRAARPAAGAATSLGLADGLIIVGTLPAFAFFWMVVPGLLGLITVIGVVGAGPGARPRAAAA